MDIKKALSYTAIGFLLTLIEFNLTLNGATVNVTPDFIGWLLLFLAFDKFGGYMAGRDYLKWGFLVLVIIKACEWVIAVFHIGIGVPTVIGFIINLAEMVIMFLFFGVLEKVTRDVCPEKESTVRTLKIINLALMLGVVVLGILFALTESTAFAALVILVGVAALVAAIVTAVVLFQIRKTAMAEQ